MLRDYARAFSGIWAIFGAVAALFTVGTVLGPTTTARADQSAGTGVGDISIATMQKALSSQSGGGWGPSGPGGTCAPSDQVNCIDAATARVLGKQLLSAVLGQEVTDPTLLNLLDALQGARTVVKSTYLEFSLYFEGSFAYVFPPPAAGAKPLPIQSLSFPKTLVLEVSSDGESGTVTLQKPERDWRLSSLRLVATGVPANLYVEELQVNLLQSTLSLEAGVWDVLSIWEKTSLTTISLSLDWGRTLLSNLQLFFLPLIFH